MDTPLRAAVLALLSGADSVATIARRNGYAGVSQLGRDCKNELGLSPHRLLGLSREREYRFDYDSPFHLEQMRAYLNRDPCSASEQLEGNRFTRYFPAKKTQVRVTLVLCARHCRVLLERKLAPAQWLNVQRAVFRLLGGGQPLEAFYRLLKTQPPFTQLAHSLYGLRIPQLPTLWETLAWAVMGQQINLGFASKLRNRLIRLAHGQPISQLPSPPDQAALLPFPDPELVLNISPDLLRQQQFSRQKISYLHTIAEACGRGFLSKLSLRNHTPSQAEAALCAIKGIGRWSAAYALLRHLGDWDALPVGDTGLRSALQAWFKLTHPPDIVQQERLMEPLRPYRGLATHYLWRSGGRSVLD